MVNVPILSFNAGELSPQIDARSDTEKYSSGCRHLENFIPRIYGSAERRPGTKYVNRQYGSGTSVRMVPFIYSSDTAYPVELGDLYARPFEYLYWENDKVYYEGDELFDCWAPITTTYLTADLFELQHKQVGDTMWIVHPDYPQKKLTRTSTTKFSIDTVPFSKGPFLTRNDLIDPNVTDTAYMVLAEAVIKESAGSGTTTTGFYGTSWRGCCFECPASCTVSSIELHLVDANAASGSVVVSFRRATPDTVYPPRYKVSGSAYLTDPDINDATGTVACSAIGTSAAWHEFTLSTPVNLTEGEWYSIVARASSADGSHQITWTITTTNIDPKVNSSDISGGQWYGDSGADFYFRLNGTIQAGSSSFGSTPSTMTCQDADAAAIAFFESGHVGSLFKLTYPREDKVSKGSEDHNTALPFTICAAIDVKGSFRFNTSGLWIGTIELQRNENSAGWETIEIWVGVNNFNASYSAVEDADNVQYRAVVTEYTTQEDEHHDDWPWLNANITVSNSTQDTIVEVTSITSTSVAAIAFLSGTVITDATKRWAEGAWSPKRRYPISMGFFEDRCVYAGMKVIQAQVTPDYIAGQDEPKLPTAWLSHSGDYENFEAGVKAADSFELVVTSTNDVRWLESLEGLVLGTSGDEWRIGSNRMEQPITPTNYSVRQQSSWGGRNIQAVKVNEQVLFVDFVGRKVRELTFNGDKYVAPDLTSLAEHITSSGIVDMAYQRNPDSILWCVLNDGSLVAMTYERDQNVVAWHKQPIDGDVLSVCVVPAADEDEIWLAIDRSDIIRIEKMMPRDFGDSIETAFFVDSGITYSNAETVLYEDEQIYWEGHEVLYGDTFSTIKNLGHLDGKTVVALVDGEVYTDLGVSNGQVTLPTGVTGQKAHVGKTYTSKLQPMRIITGTPRGTSQGSITRVPKMTISFLDTMDAQCGAFDAELKDVNWDDPAWENSSDIAGLFTGDIVVSVDGGFSVQNPIIVSTNAPLPCTVRALIPRLEVTGD